MKIVGWIMAIVGGTGFVIVFVSHNLAIRRLNRMMRDIEERKQ